MALGLNPRQTRYGSDDTTRIKFMTNYMLHFQFSIKYKSFIQNLQNLNRAQIQYQSWRIL